MEAIYESIQAGTSKSPSRWFNDLAQAVFSLEQHPERGAIIPENKRLRHLLFGNKQGTYRIIYTVDKRNAAVTVLHIRHGARKSTPEPMKNVRDATR
jgi:mRNA-degrading endonuclease RelE of RelBE toxin-antitoxin system